MKFLIQLISIAAVTFILQSFFPWWSLAIGAFIIGYFFNSGAGKSFLAGFLGVGLLWIILALLIDFQTSSILSEKISQLFPGKSVIVLFLVTGIVGGLSGGLAAMTGAILQTKK